MGPRRQRVARVVSGGDNVTYSRQAYSSGGTADVAESPTRVHVPPPHSSSDEQGAPQTPAGSLAPFTHQFCTHPSSGAQSAACEHGIDSGRPAQPTNSSNSGSSFMWSSVRPAIGNAQDERVSSG